LIGHRTILEQDSVPDIGVEMLKFGRRVGVPLIGGFAWLDFDA
jgi:hypothetical protein